MGTDSVRVLDPTVDIVSVPDGGGDASASAMSPTAASSLRRGHSVGRYVILDQLGAGGMGVVYGAYDPDLHRRVAIKVLVANHGGTFGSTRMLREAQAMAQLAHPNVVAVHDVGTVDDHVYIAMEVVDGRTLTRWQRDEKRSWAEILPVYLQAGRGLAAAHAHELVHRDFKPDNAMIDAKGRVRVMDFGLARTWGVRGPGGKAGPVDDDGPSLPDDTPLLSEVTRDGAVIGTPAYMAPEQYRGSPTDARTDQFSFCVALWEALHGQRPFSGSGPTEVATAVMEGRIVEPPSAGLPAAIDRALRRGLSTEPDDRWPTLEALLDELATALAPRRGPGVLVASVVGVAALAGLGALTLRPDNRCTGADEALVAMWNPERASSIQARFSEVEGDPGAEIWAKQRRRVDDWTKSWVASHEESCRASTIRGEQSSEVMELRMRCLRRARIGLDAALEVLGDADSTTVQKAADVVGGLPSLSRCDDVDALSRGVEGPPPELVEEVDAIHHQVAEAWALVFAGHYEEALALEQRTEAAATEVGYDPALAEVLFALMQLQKELADLDTATATAKRMVRVAARNGQWADVVAGIGGLMYMIGSLQARPDEALALADFALGLADRVDDADAEARLLTAIGAARSQTGRDEEAEAAYAKALELRRSIKNAPPDSIASAVTNLAAVKARTGRLEEALAGEREALALYIDALGPDHPFVGQARFNLGAVLNMAGRPEESGEEYRKAQEILEQTLRPTHPDVLIAKDGVAIALAHEGRLREAGAILEEVVQGRVAELGEAHPETALARNHLALFLLEQGNASEAEPVARAALKTFQDEAEHDIGLPYAAGLLARALAVQGKAAEALPFGRRAVELVEDDEGGTLQPAFPMVHAALGEVLLAGGQIDEARTELELAWDRGHDDPTFDRVAAAFTLARVLWLDEAQRRRAHELADKALSLQGDEDTPRRRTLTDWLAAHPLPT